MMQNQDTTVSNSIESSTPNTTVKVEKESPPKKSEKKDGPEDPKPRIVLTFRSEKSGAKSSNMKIVTPEEKQEEISPRRSSRTRHAKADVYEEPESSKRDKSQSSQPVSENDDTSDSSHAHRISSRARGKEATDTTVTARKERERSYSEAVPAPPQRLSRRIKPTAKILANEELRIGLESQNNARLGIQSDKSEEGVSTRRSGHTRPAEIVHEKRSTKRKVQESKEPEAPPEGDNSVMKLKHLCELGLKAINKSGDEGDEEDEEHENSETNVEGAVGEDEEIDDDTEIINKLLEADEEWGGESSDDEYLLSEDNSQSDRPRRSRRLCSNYGANDSDHSSMTTVEEKPKSRPRRSTRLAQVRFGDYGSEAPERDEDNESVEPEFIPKRKKSRSSYDTGDLKLEIDDEENWEFQPKRKKGRAFEADDKSDNEEENSKPAAAEEGSEAACPADAAAVVATCYCEEPGHVHASPSDLTEPVFCQAIESVDGLRVGCSHGAAREAGAAGERRLAAMLRAGPRAPFLLACRLHAAQLAHHMCCPSCGLFCTQGIFYQCSKGHLFHLECGIPSESKQKPGCPHCGVTAYRWQPANRDCCKVQLQMHCSNERQYLPDQRVQRTAAYLSFSTREKALDETPVIPEDLLPSLPVDLKKLCDDAKETSDSSDDGSIERLYEAILRGETVEQLIPKMVRGSRLAAAVEAEAEAEGGTCAHAAAARGALGALCVLHFAGAPLDALDARRRTPLMRALLALLEKETPEMEIDVKTEKDDLEDVPNEESKEQTEEPQEQEKAEVEKIKEETTEQDKVETEETIVAVKEELPEDTIKEKLPEEIKKEIQEEVAGERKPNDSDLLKVIRYLVAAGCDLDMPGPEGMTALHIAAQLGGEEACEILLDGGAHVDARDDGGWTPLVRACENSHAEVVGVLLRRGASALAADAEGNSAAHWAALGGAARALRLLLAAAPPAARAANRHADTPLHVAARQGHYPCVAILLARGAPTDVENAAGELPKDVCSGQCQAAICLSMQIAQLNDATPRRRLLDSDISRGREPFPVECVNEVDNEPAPQFTYVSRHVMPEPIHIDYSLQAIQGCSCAEGSCAEGACACGELGVRRWYRAARLPPAFPYHDPPMLFECAHTCACDLRRCTNHVVSRIEATGSIGVRVTVFKTTNRGWGLRARQPIQRGTAVALYCGELLPHSVADARPQDHYMFALDIKPDLIDQCPDKMQLCVDAARMGSCARFINHSCRPNLAPVRVFTASRDLRLPAVALFAVRDVPAGEELTFDYGDKFWAVKSKWMKCECESPECRYPMQTIDES